MSRLLTHLRRRAGDERGAALLLVAIGLPAFILFGAFVIDVGNWWVHKRHLQVQADSAALAGAMRFTYPDCSNDLIAGTAIEYSGGRELQPGDAAKLGSPTYWNAPPAAWPGFTPVQNAQLGGANNRSIVRTGVNRPNVLGRQETADIPADLGDAATYSATDLSTKPCSKGFVDVKMTEARDTTASPFHFFNAWWTPHYIDAQARVMLKKLKSLTGLMPIGVEDVNPKRAHVWFYDEDDPAHTVLGEAELYRHGTAPGGLAVFDNEIANGQSTGPITFSPHAQRIGVKISLSGSDASVACTDVTGRLLRLGDRRAHTDPRLGHTPRAAAWSWARSTCSIRPVLRRTTASSTRFAPQIGSRRTSRVCRRPRTPTRSLSRRRSTAVARCRCITARGPACGHPSRRTATTRRTAPRGRPCRSTSVPARTRSRSTGGKRAARSTGSTATKQNPCNEGSARTLTRSSAAIRRATRRGRSRSCRSARASPA